MIDFPELDFLDFLPFFLSEHTRVPDTVKWDLNQDTLSLDDDIVFELILLVKDNIWVSLQIKILIAPVLSGLGKEVGTSEFLYPTFQDDDKFVNNWTLFEDDFIGFVVASPHVLEEFLLIGLDETEELAVFLEDVFGIVLKHDLLEILLTDNFGQGLSAKHLASDLFFSPHCHFSYGVVI